MPSVWLTRILLELKISQVDNIQNKGTTNFVPETNKSSLIIHYMMQTSGYKMLILIYLYIFP